MGIDMLGIVSAKAVDEYAGIWVEWENSKLKKTTDYMKEAQSVIILGFNAWDEMCDMAVRQKKDWEYLGEMSLSVRQRDFALILQQKGINVYARYPFISHKYLAHLAGLGAFGKNTMIITREFGPKVRFRCILTDTILDYDKPFEEDLCGDCRLCIEACPVNALSGKQVEPHGCIVGKHLDSEYVDENILTVFEPKLGTNSHVMCKACQEVCPYCE